MKKRRIKTAIKIVILIVLISLYKVDMNAPADKIRQTYYEQYISLQPSEKHLTNNKVSQGLDNFGFVIENRVLIK